MIFAARATVAVVLACSYADCAPACAIDPDEEPPKPREVADLGTHCYGGRTDAAESLGELPTGLRTQPGAEAAVVSIHRNELLLHRRNADGTLEEAEAIGAVDDVRDLRIVDVGGDGDDDIIVLSGVRDVDVFVANDTGGFVLAKMVDVLPDAPERTIATGDFDGDGDAEFVFRSFATLILQEIEADGSSGPSREIHEGTVADSLWTVEADGSAGAELLVLDNGALKLVDVGVEEATFLRPIETTLFEPGDFNGDGIDELAIVEDDSVGIYALDADALEARDRIPFDETTTAWVDAQSKLVVTRIDPDDRADLFLVSLMQTYDNSCGREYGDVGKGWIALSGGPAAAFEHSVIGGELESGLEEPGSRRMFDVDGDGWAELLRPQEILPARPCS